MLRNDKLYKIFKWLAQYFLPACSTLYFTLANIWNLPYTVQIIGTISALDIFFGILVGMSTKIEKHDGVMLIDTTGEKDIYRLQLNDEINSINNKKNITLSVDNRATLS